MFRGGEVARFVGRTSRRSFLCRGVGALAVAALGSAAAACSSLPIGKQGAEITHADTFVGDDAKFWDPYLAKFKDQTGITVKTQPIPFQGYHDKMVSLTTAKQLPDVIWTFDATVAEQAALGGLKDLTALAQQEGPAFAKDFADDPWNAVQWNGKLWGIPWISATVGLFMNTKMFQEAKLVDGQGKPIAPKNWDEMLDYIKR